jgi:hypothetical protein
MVLARVIREAKPFHQIRRGRPIQTLENNSATVAEFPANRSLDSKPTGPPDGPPAC